MIIVNSHGRMGNQYFEYAFARNLQEKLKEKYGVEHEIFINFGVEGDMLKHTNAKYCNKTVKNSFIKKIIIILNRYVSCLFKTEEAKIKYSKFIQSIINFFGIYYSTIGFINYKIYKRKNYILDGYFQSEKYFIDYKYQIKAELQNKNVKFKQKEKNSVCVHIRRGDYVTKGNERFLICSVNYYKNAIKKFDKAKYIFYIFSDDVEWCKKNLNLSENVVYEKKDSIYYESFEDMYTCNNFILSNSSFSWWAQYLSSNPQKIIAPSIWNKETNNKDIYLKNWITIEEDEGRNETK